MCIHVSHQRDHSDFAPIIAVNKGQVTEALSRALARNDDASATAILDKNGHLLGKRVVVAVPHAAFAAAALQAKRLSRPSLTVRVNPN